MRCLRHHSELPQNRRMMRCKIIRKAWIQTIRRAGILCQVIGSHREKIRHRCQLLRTQCSRRRLNNHTHRQIFSMRHLLPGQLLFAFLYDFPAFLHLPDRGNHRKHNGQIPIYRCSQKRSKLPLEEISSCKAQAHTAKSQCRIFLFLRKEIVRCLVRTQIPGSNDDLLVRKRFHYAPVRLILLLLRRFCRRIQIQKFRPEQAHALRPVLPCTVQILKNSNVGPNRQLSAVFQDKRLSLQRLQLLSLTDAQLFLLFHRTDKRRLRIHIHRILLPVQDGCFSVPLLRQLQTAGQKRNPHRLRQNRGMRQTCYTLCQNRADRSLRKLQNFSRCQALRRENDPSLRHFLFRFTARRLCRRRLRILCLCKILQQLGFQIFNICTSLEKIRILRRVEAVPNSFHTAADRLLRRIAVLRDQLLDAGEQPVIIENLRIETEDFCILFSSRRHSLSVQGQMLLLDPGPCGFKTPQLLLRCLCRQLRSGPRLFVPVPDGPNDNVLKASGCLCRDHTNKFLA